MLLSLADAMVINILCGGSEAGGSEVQKLAKWQKAEDDLSTEHVLEEEKARATS